MILVSGIFMVGCSVQKWTDVGGEPGYREMIGKEFQMTSDGLFYKFSKSEKEINLDKAGRGHLPEVKDIPVQFPQDYYGQQILGLAPAGTTFRIVRAMRFHSFENDYVVYKAQITSPGSFQGVEVDPTGLTNRETIPQFEPAYVKELVALGLNEGKTRP